MNSFSDTNVSQQGQDFANKAADKVKGGIDKTASTLSEVVPVFRTGV
jgi:hypothetical protein